MQTRKLGAAGPEVSAIGVGAMSLTSFYGPVTEDEALNVLHTALDLGIDHLDTSNVYGMGLSERIIGKFLATHKGESPFRIATKAGITRDAATGARCYDNSAEHLTAELDASLARMGIDRVDLFYVHRRDPSVPIEEVAGSLGRLVDAGKIGAIGFSEIAPSSLRRAAAVHPVAAVQSEYSLSTRAPELGLVQATRDLGTALVAFSPVGRGLLTDTPPTAETVQGSDFLKGNPRFQEPDFSANLAQSDLFRELAAEMGTPASALAIAWLLHQGQHVIPIPGTRSAAHLRELAAGGDLRLSPNDMARIEAALPLGWASGDRYSDAQWIGPERYS